MQHTVKIGFHVSIAGGISNAPRAAVEKGYSAFQFFPSSSRSWSVAKASIEEGEKFRKLVKENGLEAFAHVPYLCNPASPDKAVLEKSKNMLIEDMEICSGAGVKHMVVHMGSHKGEGKERGISMIVGTLGYALDKVKDVELLLENSAGYTNSMGSDFAEIGKVLDLLGRGKVGVCLDTCHAFAAGYDFGSKESIEKLASEINDYIGLEKLKLIHLNDAKYPLGSGLDRHWHIGKGYIGEKGFINFFENKAFNHGNFILETPYQSEGDDARNLNEVKKLMGLSGIKL
ncbi:MAG: deoxyribonuclease IV [Candidatus Micrarchaeia archaeon]